MRQIEGRYGPDPSSEDRDVIIPPYVGMRPWADGATGTGGRIMRRPMSVRKADEQYKLSPQVTRRRLYYETMERVLSNVDKTIVEARGVTPYLPLNEVQRRVAPSAPEAATKGGQ